MKNISDIPNDRLVRIFFRKLWQGYDAGGFSVGRSLQSNLVEAYTALNNYDDLENPPIDLRGLSDEARRRKPITSQQMILGNLGNLSIISNHDISMLCIEALRVWYQIHKDERNSQGYVANTWEGRFVTSICTIMPIPFFPYFKSDADIIKIWKEADDRIRNELVYKQTYFLNGPLNSPISGPFYL